jgi:imidazolonepropionase-like amidohydrolase
MGAIKEEDDETLKQLSTGNDAHTHTSYGNKSKDQLFQQNEEQSKISRISNTAHGSRPRRQKQRAMNQDDILNEITHLK